MAFSREEPSTAMRDIKEPHKNKVLVAFALICSIIWSILYGIFTFNTDASCSENELIGFTTIAFWIFLVCAQLELIILVSILLNYKTNPDSKYWSIFNWILLVADLTLGLFIYIRGMIVIVNSDTTSGCDELYYLVLVYEIIASILLAIFALAFIIVGCIFIFCACFSKQRRANNEDNNNSSNNTRSIVIK